MWGTGRIKRGESIKSPMRGREKGKTIQRAVNYGPLKETQEGENHQRGRGTPVQLNCGVIGGWL